MIKQILFIWLTLHSIALQAQDADTLPTFNISGTRIQSSLMESGRNVQLITRKQIESMPVTSLNEVLQYVAGLDFRQRGAFGAQADVSVRGGTFDQTLVLVNGIKMSDPQTGHHQMNLGIDLSAIQQIEVIKGPAAARYGLNAFSGVINIITLPSAKDELTISTTVAQDAQEASARPFYGGYDLNTTVNIGSEQSRHLISMGRLQSTGYRPNTDLNRNRIFYHGSTNTKFGQFEAMGNIVQNAFGASGFYAFPIDSNSEEAVLTYLAAVKHRITFKRFNINSSAYSRKNFDTYTLFREAPDIFQNKHRTDVEGAEIHATYAYSIGSFGLGLEYRREAINSSNLGQWARENSGFFIENRVFMLRQKLAFNTGAYINISSDYGTQFLPSVEASYRISKHWSIFGNAGQSFRVPTFTDLYYIGPTNIGNASLRPERSDQLEGGVKWGSGTQIAQVSYFFQRSYDLIDWVRASEMEPWMPENFESVHTQGIDASSTWQFDRKDNTLFGFDLLRLSYTYLNMQRAGSDVLLSRYALNNLNHQINANLSVHLGNNLTFGLNGRYLVRNAYKDYTLIDLRIQYRHQRFEWWLDASNVLNTDYIEAANAPMPGRWLRSGVLVRLR